MNAEFETMVFDHTQHVHEAILLVLDEQRICAVSGHSRPMQWRTSCDRGRTWDEAKPLADTQGQPVAGHRASLCRLKSGRLGLVYNAETRRPGRDGILCFRASDDEGKCWSERTIIDPGAAVMRNGTMRVLESGRVVCPVFSWMSSLATGESEYPGASLCWSWTHFSDDEGESWQRSVNEIYVPQPGDDLQGAFDFEEPALEVLKDGRLLMFGRTRLGRIYQSLSADQGESWSKPEPTLLASNYTPPHLWRIPQTGDLLCIWNQADANEMWAGYHRFRLSSAVSTNEGATWQHYRNLESRDDACYVPPGPIMVYRQGSYGYAEPVDTGRYHRSDSGSRICYPATAAMGDEVLVCYDYGFASNRVDARGNKQPSGHGTKLRALPVTWFYESKISPPAVEDVTRPGTAV